MEHLIFLLVMALGHIAHILKAVVQTREMDNTVTLSSYIIRRPYKTALSVIGSLIGYLMLYDTDQLTMVAALGVGYMADSVFEVLSTKARSKM